MLVLSRKPGESLLIGDNIVVTLVRIGPNSCRLGVTAPRAINIARDELAVTQAPQPAEACCDADEDDDTEMGGEGLQ